MESAPPTMPAPTVPADGQPLPTGAAVYPTRYGRMAVWENDQAFVASLARGEVYEQGLLEAHVLPIARRARVIVDVGAHIGSHTLPYAAVNPRAQIVSFEPQAAMRRLLTWTLAANGVTTVRVVAAAAAHKATRAAMGACVADGDNANKPIAYGGDKSFNLGGLALGTGGEAIDAITIDSLALPHCDLLKIDAEGAEPFVLLGAAQTLARCHPAVVFEENDKRVTPAMLASLGETREPTSTRQQLRAHGYTRIIPIGNDTFLAQ
jgi:FkbM family methyltransferase